VRWFDVNPATVGPAEGQVTPYGTAFRGGVRIGVLSRYDDLDRVDILTAPGKGLAADVKRFDALTAATLDSFFAYDDDFKGGAFVAGS
jgi:hypothetical protein